MHKPLAPKVAQEVRALRRMAGHMRAFRLANGKEGSVTCCQVRLKGRLVKFLSLDVYNQAGDEVLCAYKLRPARKWKPMYEVDQTWLFEQIMESGVYRPNTWIRLEVRYA